MLWAGLSPVLPQALLPSLLGCLHGDWNCVQSRGWRSMETLRHPESSTRTLPGLQGDVAGGGERTRLQQQFPGVTFGTALPHLLQLGNILITLRLR